MTEAERNAAWDQRFDVALGDFDQRLAREQAELEKQRAAGGGQNGGAGGSGGGGNAQSGAAGGGGTMPEEMHGAGPGDGSNPGGMIGGGGLGNPTPGPRFPAPTGTPDGRDDDVVAKQLREAAEKEPDPELRAKLWDEYRKYKGRKS